jgi:hypothetical protein
MHPPNEKHDGSQLDTDAAEVRRQLRNKGQILTPVKMPPWKKVILFTLFISLVFGASLLLIFRQSRQQLVAQIAGAFVEAYSDQDPEIFPLPPPPPQSVKTKIGRQGPFVSSSDEEFSGVLYSSSDIRDGDETENGEDTQFVAPPKTKESQKAFDFLTATSSLARKLRENQLAGYELKQWRPLKDDSPVFIIDLTVLRAAENRELHLIWEVNLSEETVRPLSQLARDLEDSSGSEKAVPDARG